MKTFTIAGTSNLNGVTKLRVANGSLKHRVNVLSRDGHTEINLTELPSPMTRDEARQFLKIGGFGTGAETTFVVSEATVTVNTDQSEDA